MKLRTMLALSAAVGRNDLGRIEALCLELLRADRHNTMALAVLADAYWRHDRPDQALAHALELLERLPGSLHALRIAAGISARRGEHARAYDFARRLVAAEPPGQPPAQAVSRALRQSLGSQADWQRWARDYIAWYESASQAG